MKLLQILAFVTVAHFTSAVAVARIDETFEECQARYSTARLRDKETARFVKGDIVIDVAFFEGKAGRIIFYRTDERPMSPAEISTLMEANSAGQGWTKVTGVNSGDSTVWKTDDGARQALLNEKMTILIIHSKAYLNHLIAEKEKKKKEALEGF